MHGALQQLCCIFNVVTPCWWQSTAHDPPSLPSTPPHRNMYMSCSWSRPCTAAAAGPAPPSCCGAEGSDGGGADSRGIDPSSGSEARPPMSPAMRGSLSAPGRPPLPPPPPAAAANAATAPAAGAGGARPASTLMLKLSGMQPRPPLPPPSAPSTAVLRLKAGPASLAASIRQARMLSGIELSMSMLSCRVIAREEK